LVDVMVTLSSGSQKSSTCVFLDERVTKLSQALASTSEAVCVL